MSLNQLADCVHDLFTSASFQSGRPVGGLAELIAEESGERPKLRDRSLEQLPACDHQVPRPDHQDCIGRENTRDPNRMDSCRARPARPQKLQTALHVKAKGEPAPPV